MFLYVIQNLMEDELLAASKLELDPQCICLFAAGVVSLFFGLMTMLVVFCHKHLLIDPKSW